MKNLYEKFAEYAEEVTAPFKQRKKQHIHDYLHSKATGVEPPTPLKFSTLNVRVSRHAYGKPEIRWYQSKPKYKNKKGETLDIPNNVYIPMSKFRTNVANFKGRNPWELEYGVHCEDQLARLREIIYEIEIIRRKLEHINNLILGNKRGTGKFRLNPPILDGQYQLALTLVPYQHEEVSETDTITIRMYPEK